MKRIVSLVICWVIILVFSGISSAAEKVFFYTTDPAGSPVAITDSTGTVVWRADYKPFGQEQSISGSLENNERFIGKEKDKETGLDYFGARYMYDKAGRFTSPDPVGPVDLKTSQTSHGMLLNPQKLNAYTYALNNPYRYVDPDGRMPWLLPLLYNLLLPSSANAPESRESMTVHSQTTGEFVRGVAVMEAGGFVVGRAIVGARTVGSALSVESKALLEARPTGSALKDDIIHRSASFMREEAAQSGAHFQIVGGDGSTRTLTQFQGTLNGQAGRFEYIVEKSGNLTHQRFVSGGSINGVPNTP